MSTYRCKACHGIYVSPQQGMTYFHACPPVIDDPVTGRAHHRPDHRDENLVQILPGPEAPPQPRGPGGLIGTVHMRSRGPGRVRISNDDLVSGADAAALEAMRAQAGTDEPDP